MQAKKAFALLLEQKAEIESLVGALDWMELPEGQDCRIKQMMQGDTKNSSQWPTIYKWLKERSELFHGVFSSRIKSLEL